MKRTRRLDALRGTFGLALDDAFLPIKKRLFFTATPRHYDVSKQDKEGNAPTVYSMDVPKIYGPVIYRLGFAEAVQRDIICNYKVVVSIVTSEMVARSRLLNGEVMINGESIRARQVANQIALQMAVTKYEVTKIITFHRSIASSKSTLQI